MALVTICSSKGAPGATSTALALAAQWPTAVTLVEADPTGGDLALRVRLAGGGEMAPRPSLLDLALAVRSEYDPDRVLSQTAQALACGVAAVRGVDSSTQAEGASQLWGRIAQCLRAASGDVLVDVGRVASAPKELLAAAHRILIVGPATLEGVVHLRETARELQTRSEGKARVTPVLVGAARFGAADCADLDRVLRDAGVHAGKAMPLAWEPATLAQLETSATAGGKRPEKSAFLASAKAIAEQLASPESENSPVTAGRRAAAVSDEAEVLS